MRQTDLMAMTTVPLLILPGAGMALASSQGVASWGGVPILASIIALIFLIQWLAFIPAYLRQTESFFDLTGSATFILATLLAVLASPTIDGRSIMLLGLITIWSVRLGTFLFRRIHRTGKDGRFDRIKPSFIRFLSVWTMQAVWVTFTLSAALIAITATTRQPLGWVGWLGGLIWAGGFAIEVVADAQKSQFRANPANRDKFIQTGLWAYSRHPNYLGEIILWTGIMLIALPIFGGWQWVGVISPLFVTVQLVFISGIPLLEKRADAKWGGQPAYEAYKKRTPLLFPRP